jgi:16S rRNA (guanine966-N2)-methyltransferase
VFVELDGMAGATLRQNLRFTRLETHALLITADVRDALRSLSKRGEVFDVIFADPPYSKGQGTRNKEQGAKWKAPTDWKSLLLASADLKAVLAPGGALLLEYYKYDAGLDSPHFRPEKEFRFGDTLITLFGHV